jgi:hypothetical protein
MDKDGVRVGILKNTFLYFMGETNDRSVFWKIKGLGD